MMNFGSKNVKGGFFGTRMLTGYFLHGPDGELLQSGSFIPYPDIDPPETTAPPTVPPTSIGTVTVAGPASPIEGDVDTYSVTNDGDAGNLSYAWSIVGGTGSSSSASCQVTWGNDGPGQVSCTITSTDENIQDSPVSDTLNVTIQPQPTSIGSLNLSGDFSVNEGDTETYSITNTGDAGNLTYLWSITGGTGSSTTDSCQVVWGTEGVGSVECTVTSGDEAPTDSPQTASANVTITATTTPPLPLPNAPTNVSITTSDYTPTVPTSIGTVTVSGDNDVETGDVETYSVSNSGDAGNLTYNWTIVGGAGSSTTDTCEVTWGPDGTGSVSCTITSGDDAPTDSPASSSISVTINAVPTTAPPTTPPPGGGITPVNDNQVRFYVPASANSFTVLGMTNTGYFAISDDTNTSPVTGGGYYTGTSYFYMYGNSPATLSTLAAGDRVIRLYPTDAAGTYDPNGIIYGFSLTNNTEPVTGVDFSHCTGLKYAGMSSVNGSSRKQFGSVANSLAPSTITEVRAVDVVLGTDPQSYYSVTYNPQYYNGWYWSGGGGDLAGQQMSGAALDQLYTDLASDAGDPSLGTLIVANNPGTSSDDPTIATGKGYTVSE